MNTNRFASRIAGRFLSVCLALLVAGGISACAIGGDKAAPLDAEPGIDSGTQPIPDAPPGLTIVTPPANQVVAVNSTVSLSAVIEGQTEKIEWFKKGEVIAGANELTLTLKNVQLSDSGEYVLKVSRDIRVSGGSPTRA